MALIAFKYLFETALLIVSALPVVAEKRFRYFGKRISKICLTLTAAILVLSIANDTVSFKEINVLERRIADTEKASKPVPLSVRLRKLLEEIDPKIIPSLAAGRTGFEGGITTSQFTRLQTLAHENGANAFISVDPDSVRMGIGMGPEGITYNVAFKLDPELIEMTK